MFGYSITELITAHTDDEKITMEILAPGINKEDAEISIRDGQLAVAIPETKFTPAWDNVYKLPFSLEEKQVKAEYKEGILTVVINRPENYLKKVPIN